MWVMCYTQLHCSGNRVKCIFKSWLPEDSGMFHLNSMRLQLEFTNQCNC